mgnify:CR=1 FL=1
MTKASQLGGLFTTIFQISRAAPLRISPLAYHVVLEPMPPFTFFLGIDCRKIYCYIAGYSDIQQYGCDMEIDRIIDLRKSATSGTAGGL